MVWDDVYLKLQQANKKLFPHNPLNRLRVGDLVRVSWETVPEERKIAVFRKGYMAKWSRDIYIIRSVGRGQNPRYTIAHIPIEGGDVLPQYYLRHELLHISDDTVRKEPNDNDNDLPPLEGEEAGDDNEDVFDEPRTRRNPTDPLNLINKRISVYWKDRRRYFPGLVVSWSLGRRLYLVRYDKGNNLFEEEEDHEVFEDLANERYKII
jgi:hypothetical protein